MYSFIRLGRSDDSSPPREEEREEEREGERERDREAINTLSSVPKCHHTHTRGLFDGEAINERCDESTAEGLAQRETSSRRH